MSLWRCFLLPDKCNQIPMKDSDAMVLQLWGMLAMYFIYILPAINSLLLCVLSLDKCLHNMDDIVTMISTVYPR